MTIRLPAIQQIPGGSRMPVVVRTEDWRRHVLVDPRGTKYRFDDVPPRGPHLKIDWNSTPPFSVDCDLLVQMLSPFSGQSIDSGLMPSVNYISAPQTWWFGQMPFYVNITWNRRTGAASINVGFDFPAEEGAFGGWDGLGSKTVAVTDPPTDGRNAINGAEIINWPSYGSVIVSW